jgi:leucyl-tRNA synthetase
MKTYDHKKIENKWQKDWEKKKIYKTLDSSKKPKYYVLDMFPYLSGEGLHVGHPKGYIATDVISRMKRMQGANVMHPMGFDAFGLPAENYALKTKTNPAVSVPKNVIRFKKQLEILGFDYDWSREVNTTDPKFYKWTEWIFLKLLEKGLAYESYEPINWCPSCKTGLANEDVEDGKCERCGTVVEQKPMRQWVLRITNYAERLLKDLDSLDWPLSIKESQKNWIGKSEGSEIRFKIKVERFKDEDSDLKSANLNLPTISVFTTRADTIFGATYVVLAPEHNLILKIKSRISNWNEVEKYIKKVKKETNIERTAEGKIKTGIEIKGVKAINPATGEEIPIWIADYVLASYGTGAVMAVPAHDERDFEFAKKYNLPIKQVIMPHNLDLSNPPRKGKKNTRRNVVHVILRNRKEKTILVEFLKGEEWENKNLKTFIIGGMEDGESKEETALREIKEETGYVNVKFIQEIPFEVEAEFFAAHKDVNRIVHTTGMIFDLIDEKKVEISSQERKLHDIKWISESDVADIITIPDDKMIWQYFSKGGFAFTDNGILINSNNLNGTASEEARRKITETVGGKMVTKYKLRDWVFSRQRYWGEPIPVLHDGDKIVPIKEKDLPVILPKVKSYEPTGTGESPLANILSWVNVKVGKGKNAKIMKRETNTMPQWAGSSWYYLRYMDPKNDKSLVDKKKEKYWNQVDFYVGGAEHATRHLIYARFWHKFLYDIGVVSTLEPFKKLQSVGLIIGEDGRKMSKRFGNIVNPDDIVKTYGADTLRVYEMFIGPFDQTVVWNTNSIIGSRRFLEKVWRLGQSIAEQKKGSKDNKSSIAFQTLLHKTIKKVTEDIESMNFNTAVSAMMVLVNEMERQVASSKEQVVSKNDFKMFLQILSPFAPHITEELWSDLTSDSDSGRSHSIHLSSWPIWDEKKIVEEEVKIAIQVNGKVRAEIMISKGMGENEVKEIALKNKSIIAWIENKEIKKFIFVPGRIINIVV